MQIADLFDLADLLPEVTRSDHGRYWRIAVSDRTFGYRWEPTRIVGLKQTIAEQLALVDARLVLARLAQPAERTFRSVRFGFQSPGGSGVGYRPELGGQRVPDLQVAHQEGALVQPLAPQPACDLV